MPRGKYPRTKKAKQETRWTNVAKQILQRSSELTELLRDALPESLEQARARLQAFIDAWTKTGEGDVLPASGENSDIDGCLNDCDVIQFIVQAIEMKQDAAERE